MALAAQEKQPVSTTELAEFTRQLGAMLDIGVDVLRALRVAGQHSRSPVLVDIADDVGRLLQDGRELHRALGRHPTVFGQFYLEVVRQGEADGQLGTALLAIADYLDRSAGQGIPPAAPAGTTLSSNMVALTMVSLGVLALGAAAIWAVNSAGWLDDRWLAPAGLVWAGVCLLAGAWLMVRVRQAMAGGPVVRSPGGKSSERRQSESEGLARGVLMDQQQDEEDQGLRAISEDPAVIFGPLDPLAKEDGTRVKL